MQIRFADAGPRAIMRWSCRSPAKTAPALNSLGAAQQAVVAALDRQRFDGEAASAAEQFIDDSGTSRRLLVVGTGSGSDQHDSGRKAWRHRGRRGC